MLQQFNFQDHTVRVVLDDNNQPMFVAKDVATTLGYIDTNSAIKQHCKGTPIYHPLETNGGVQEVRVIYEPGLYRHHKTALRQFCGFIFLETKT